MFWAGSCEETFASKQDSFLLLPLPSPATGAGDTVPGKKHLLTYSGSCSLPEDALCSCRTEEFPSRARDSPALIS